MYFIDSKSLYQLEHAILINNKANIKIANDGITKRAKSQNYADKLG